MRICPFCKQDPFDYVDIGVGFQPVAVTCCDLGRMLIEDNEKIAKQCLRFMRSNSPKKKAKAMKIMRDFGVVE